MDAATRRTLRRLARTRTAGELAALFAAIRANDDAALLAEAAAPARAAIALDHARRIAALLSPIVARADEKADMLIAALARDVGPIDVQSAGLLPTIRRLSARYGEDRVLAAAKALMDDMAIWGSSRERVT
jgi:hypothetical protein